eukprot:1840675-Rhodomonas_salina.1
MRTRRRDEEKGTRENVASGDIESEDRRRSGRGPLFHEEVGADSAAAGAHGAEHVVPRRRLPQLARHARRHADRKRIAAVPSPRAIAREELDGDARGRFLVAAALHEVFEPHLADPQLVVLVAAALFQAVPERLVFLSRLPRDRAELGRARYIHAPRRLKPLVLARRRRSVPGQSLCLVPNSPFPSHSILNSQTMMREAREHSEH